MAGADTIVALASGALPAGVAVVRLSGPKSLFCLEQLCGVLTSPRLLSLKKLCDPVSGEMLDEGLVVHFPAPHSFTGEDCAEFQLHGSRAVVQRVLTSLTALEGVRLAEPGEFTRQAFENGRLDLVEVDALGDLISADTESQRAQAMARLAGGLTERIEAWRAEIISLMVEVEVQLDFSDEGDVSDMSFESLQSGLKKLILSLEEGLSSYSRGRMVREGFRVGIGGVPNAGKSSLLNVLAQSDIAIVTDEAGTTRDLREVAINLDGQLVILVDSAGIRDTDSKAEAEGVRRALDMMSGADLVIWLVAPDLSADQTCPISGPQVVVVDSKSDVGPGAGQHSVSAATQNGIAELLDLIRARVRLVTEANTDVTISHLRDHEALTACVWEVQRALRAGTELELVAESLRRAALSLERLVGRVDAEQVLDQLFAGFCIGK